MRSNVLDELERMERKHAAFRHDPDNNDARIDAENSLIGILCYEGALPELLAAARRAEAAEAELALVRPVVEAALGWTCENPDGTPFRNAVAALRTARDGGKEGEGRDDAA